MKPFLSLYMLFSLVDLSLSKARLKMRQSVPATPQPAQPTNSTAQPANPATPTNSTQIKPIEFVNPMFYFLNDTFPYKPQIRENTFLNNFKKWDYKMIEEQLRDIWSYMIIREEPAVREYGTVHFIKLFVQAFEACDKNKDNTLDMKEYRECAQTDPNFKGFLVPPSREWTPLTIFTEADIYYSTLFILNQSISIKTGNINFHEYMLLRFMVFSWKKCTSMGPFIGENSFECALNMLVEGRVLDKNMMKNLYELGLFFANNEALRNLDFISYFLVTSTVRLYTKINIKGDNNLSHREFMTALERNILPLRYNKDIINYFFELTKDPLMPDRSLDPITFGYLDFFLRLFDYPFAKRFYYLSCEELLKVIENPLFPSGILRRILKIPTLKLEESSYQMREVLNTTRYFRDDDYRWSFMETEQNTTTTTQPASSPNNSTKPLGLSPLMANSNCGVGSTRAMNITDAPYTMNRIFKVMDKEMNGWANFYNFGEFMQIGLIFSRQDTFEAGRIRAGSLYETYKSWFAYPTVSVNMRQAALRMSYLPVDAYLDLFSLYTMLDAGQVAAYYRRQSDPTVLREPEMRNVLTRLNYQFVPEPYFKNCIRLLDESRIPKFDWECTIVKAVEVTVKFWENAYNFSLIKNFGLTVRNTGYDNLFQPLNTTQGVKDTLR